MNQHDQMRELCKRLYVELYHCNKQMTSTFDDEGNQLWTTGKTVSDVLADAKQVLAAEPAPLVRLTEHQLEQLGCSYAEDFDFASAIMDAMEERNK